MKIKAFFHKIRIGFIRRRAVSIPYTSSGKKYGNQGENDALYAFKKLLPDCRFKKNIIIQTAEGNAEIDCLILYENKLFAVEIKHWKGYIQETERGFWQSKVDRWTGEIHRKIQKSPFKQLNRAIYLLRKQLPYQAWINAIVFFEDTEQVSVNNESVWFTKTEELANYIVNEGKSSHGNNAYKIFDQAISADYLYSGTKQLSCVICQESLNFQIGDNRLTRKDIVSIQILHHWSYDTLKVKTHNKATYSVDLENSFIAVNENGYNKSYALCKLDYIKLSEK